MVSHVNHSLFARGILSRVIDASQPSKLSSCPAVLCKKSWEVLDTPQDCNLSFRIILWGIFEAHFNPELACSFKHEGLGSITIVLLIEIHFLAILGLWPWAQENLSCNVHGSLLSRRGFWKLGFAWTRWTWTQLLQCSPFWGLFSFWCWENQGLSRKTPLICFDIGCSSVLSVRQRGS